MSLVKKIVFVFLNIQYPLKNTTMKLFRANALYLAIAACIFLQIPIAIAGNNHDAATLTHYLEEKTEPAAEVSMEEMIELKADSIYDTLHLLEAGLQEEAFELAYKGYYKLMEQGRVQKKDVLTIADFSKPSSQDRLFVIDMEQGKILHQTLVAHGRKSGLIYATDFSNKPESNKSSLGFFLTLQSYYGSKGYAMRLQDLEMEMQNKEKDYQAKLAMKASPAQLELSQKSFQRLQQEATETQEAYKSEIQSEQAKLYQPILDAVKKATGEVAKAKGYAHVIDNSTGSVVWSANAADDLTGAVIAAMLKK